jgi:hypothetical protein
VELPFWTEAKVKKRANSKLFALFFLFWGAFFTGFDLLDARNSLKTSFLSAPASAGRRTPDRTRMDEKGSGDPPRKGLSGKTGSGAARR